jgi:hypothetical protein
MILELHLDGELIGVVHVCPISVRKNYTEHMNQLKTALIREYQTVLSTAESRPAFVLSGVQSCINSFVSLTGSAT